MIAFLLIGCPSPPPPPPPPAFVRGGVVVGHGEGEQLGDGRVFQPKPWSPGEKVDGFEAPRTAECIALAEVSLGDLSSAVARGISAPDTAVAFDTAGRRLAVGTYLGEVLVVDAWTGAVLSRRTLAESAVKRVAWSPDGDVLYAAEQSPDAFLRALDPMTLADVATFRMADALETSAPPGPDDLYGLYTLPGAYGLEVRPDGDVLLLGAHGWNASEGRQNRSQLWRLRRDGDAFRVMAKFPEEPADATFLAMAVDVDAVAISVSRSSGGPSPEGLPVGGVQVLDAELHPRSASVPPPLAPYFDRAFVWESIGLSGDLLTLGLGDGRVWRDDTVRDLGTPVLSGDVPIAATIGHLAHGREIYAITSGTSIPYSAERADLKPPEPHPHENTLYGLDPTRLATVWTWRGEESLQGLTHRDPWLVVGTGPKDSNADRHGVVVFDTRRKGAGADRLAASCSTGQPVFFRSAVAPDGRIAVVSFPEKSGASVQGEYRVTLFL